MKEGSLDNTFGEMPGQMSSLDFLSEVQAEAARIQTPDQVPDRIDLSALPENVLRSGVIDTLMAQNDDLMARLNVTLRRIHTLEEKLHEAQTESNQYKAKYENLNDQLLVMKEQSRILAERARESMTRAQRDDRAFEELKEQIQTLEVRYAELYSVSSERQARLQEESEKALSRLSRYQKYRARMKAALIKAREDYKRLQHRAEFQENQIHDLRRNLQESADYIAVQGKNFNQEREGLVDAYEKELTKLQQEITRLNEAQQALQGRLRDYDALYDEKIRIENDLVIERRRSESREMETGKEIADLQKALARHRNEAKDLALQLATAEEQATEAKQKSETLSQENLALTEQVENLQLLWRDQQTKIEKLTEQKTALQKLNQELSQNLNQYRRDLRDLKDQLDKATYNSRQNGQSVDSKRDDITPQIIEKIDKVLADIHAGKG